MAFSGANNFTINRGEFHNVAGNYTVNFGGDGDPLDKILQCLSVVNCEGKHKKVKSTIRAGASAGEWLLRHEAYMMWKEERSSRRLLWLKGAPGAGKTVLSSVIIDDLRKNQGAHLAVVFFYCESQDPIKRDPTNVLSSLLAQLLRKIPRGSSAVNSLLERCPNSQSAHDFDLLDLITQFAREFDRTFVVVDAVDECEDLAQLLPALTDLAVEVNVLATGRDKPELRDKFREHGELIIGRDDINNDVGRFVEMDVKHVKTRDPQLVHDIISRLTSGAQGTFLWPSYHMRRLRKLRTDYDIREALDDLPYGIEDTISRALETIDEHPNSDRLRRVLRLAIYAVQPLTLRELAEGAATDEMIDVWDPTRVVTDPMSLIDDCANLLICTPSTFPHQPDVVIPFHISVKEFLANPARITGPLIKYALYPQSVVHTDLAKQCLSYLKLRCKDGGIALGIGSNAPFAKYAAEGWVEHIRASGSDVLFADFCEFLAPGSATLRVWAALCEELRLYDKNGVKDDLHLLGPEHLAVRLDLAKMIPHFGHEGLMVEDHNGSTPLCVAVERSSSLSLPDFLQQVRSNGSRGSARSRDDTTARPAVTGVTKMPQPSQPPPPGVFTQARSDGSQSSGSSSSSVQSRRISSSSVRRPSAPQQQNGSDRPAEQLHSFHPTDPLETMDERSEPQHRPSQGPSDPFPFTSTASQARRRDPAPYPIVPPAKQFPGSSRRTRERPPPIDVVLPVIPDNARHVSRTGGPDAAPSPSMQHSHGPVHPLPLMPQFSPHIQVPSWFVLPPDQSAIPVSGTSTPVRRHHDPRRPSPLSPVSPAFTGGGSGSNCSSPSWEFIIVPPSQPGTPTFESPTSEDTDFFTIVPPSRPGTPTFESPTSEDAYFLTIVPPSQPGTPTFESPTSEDADFFTIMPPSQPGTPSFESPTGDDADFFTVVPPSQPGTPTFGSPTGEDAHFLNPNSRPISLPSVQPQPRTPPPTFPPHHNEHEPPPDFVVPVLPIPDTPAMRSVDLGGIVGSISRPRTTPPAPVYQAAPIPAGYEYPAPLGGSPSIKSTDAGPAITTGKSKGKGKKRKSVTLASSPR